MRSKKLLATGFLLGTAAAAAWAPARAQCRLCETPTTTLSTIAGSEDVRLELETNIDFGRLVVLASGVGSASLRPDGSTIAQGSVQEVSPRASVGSAVVHGEPGKAVRVQLPSRIVLTSISGGQITFDDVVSDLPSLPRLDSSGRLAFRIGGRLQVQGDAEGQYRGDLPIIVEYL
jgi:hypothetical protein